MPSRSLTLWNTDGAKALDDIEGAHVAVGGSGRGRRYATEQINHAYVVLLAGQFQGFCRGLHSEAVDYLVRTSPSPIMQAILQQNFVHGRQLDRGNAQSSAIGSDFGRLGLKFWAEVYKVDRRNRKRREALDHLVEWRNGIAHQDFTNQTVRGRVLHLKHVKKWRGVRAALAGSFDTVVRAHLEAVVGKPPW
jgi:hypothetical protein